MASITMTWPKGSDTLERNLGTLDDKLRRVLVAEFEYHKPLATGYAKQNAPWTDRTGAARAGLHTVTNYGPSYFELVVAHSVYYGIYLEVCNSGKYQIIMPTIVNIGRELITHIEHALAKIDENS